MRNYIYDAFSLAQSRFLGIVELEVGWLIRVSHPYERNKKIIGIIVHKKITLPETKHDVAHGTITLFSNTGITYHSLTSAELVSKI